MGEGGCVCQVFLIMRKVLNSLAMACPLGKKGIFERRVLEGVRPR